MTKADRKRDWLYWDNGRAYLELHALRAPVGNYRPEYEAHPDHYDTDVMIAIHAFEAENDITIFALGRSGRHICIEDTPRNRRRYASLRRKAIDAANALWRSMRVTP